MTPTDIVAILGLIATAMVSIFSKVSDRPLTSAQASSAEADAMAKIVQSYETLLARMDTDNAAIRKELDAVKEEFRREKADCRKRIAELEKLVKNGGAVLPASTN